MLAASTILVLASFSAVDTPQLYEFGSNRCPACRAVEPNVAKLIAQGVPIQRVDVDKRPEWAKQARVHSLPCFIAVANGREVGRLEGAVSSQQLSRLYIQAVQRSTRASTVNEENSTNLKNPKNGVVDKDAAAAKMVRGQNPSRPSPGKRIGQALGSLTGRPKQQTCRCSGQCTCTPAKACSPATACVPANEGRAVAVGSAVHPGTPDDSAASEAIVDGATARRRAFAATVRIKVVDEIGQSYGTGTIIDVHEDEALVLTCGHIFRDSAGKGRILCDAFVPGATPGIEGTLISYDVRRDVGLISFRPNVTVTAATIGGTGQRPKVSDAVFCIGCDHGAEPTIMENNIIAVNRYHGPPNLVVGGRPVDGRSGGGLFTRDGVLIGICNAADSEYNEGVYAALGNVHAQLDDVGLGYIYREKQSSIARVDNHTLPLPATDQNHQLPAKIESKPLVIPQSRRTNPGRAGDSIQAVEQRAEVKERELICIVRSPNQTEPECVFVLDRPSKSLLDQLAAEANRRGPHEVTQMHVDNTAGNHAEGNWRSLVPSESLKLPATH